MSFRFDQPKMCDDCIHRVGKIQNPKSPYYGDSYCTVHRMACYEWKEMHETCDEKKDRFGIEESKPKEPKYRPTKASLDGFMEES